MEGLTPSSDFNHRLEYGSLWHICEEALARGDDPTRSGRADRRKPLWEDALKAYGQQLCEMYPMRQEQVDHWYNVCKVQFPVYVDYWSKHPDVSSRKPLLSEQVFHVPYSLPSGRVVYLRGKWDSVDLVGRQVFLQENKTKGDIDEVRLQRQLQSGFDLQTMLYLVALHWTNEHDRDGKGICEPHFRFDAPVAGVRYNVIRRPLSGGKGSIVRGKGTKGSKCVRCKGTGQTVYHDGRIPCYKCKGVGRTGGKPEETKDAYYARLQTIIANEPAYYFMRWQVDITPGDITRFRKECLDPILEAICDWYGWVTEQKLPLGVSLGIHWRQPYGVYNPLAEGGDSDLDWHLDRKSDVGLARVSDMFPELKEAK
jgi:hypothetical protein